MNSTPPISNVCDDKLCRGGCGVYAHFMMIHKIYFKYKYSISILRKSMNAAPLPFRTNVRNLLVPLYRGFCGYIGDLFILNIVLTWHDVETHPYTK